jgi:hypothetical protein
VTVLKGRFSTQRVGRLPRWAVTAVVCLVLIAFVAVMQVPHLHATQSDADHCPLCVVMHSTAPVTAPAPAVVLVPVGIPELKVEPLTVTQRPESSLFIRPPPAGC